MSTDKAKRTALSPSTCELCEYRIQRHRIRPGREKGNYKLGNVISLCPNHHQLADDGIIPRAVLFTVVLDRIERAFEEGDLTEEMFVEAKLFIAENINGELTQ